MKKTQQPQQQFHMPTNPQIVSQTKPNTQINTQQTYQQSNLQINPQTQQQVNPQTNMQNNIQTLIQQPSSSVPPLPSLIKSRFKDFTLLTDQNNISNSLYLLYSAVSISDGQPRTIRILNHASDLYPKNRSLAITLYLQELFYLCARFGSFLSEAGTYGKTKQDISIDFEEFAAEGDCFAFVMKETHSLAKILSNQQQKAEIDTEQMLKEVYASLNFIKSRFKVTSVFLTPESIYTIKDGTGTDGKSTNYKYYIPGWCSKVEGTPARYSAPEMIAGQAITNTQDASTAAEIYALGLIGLETAGIEYKTWKVLPYHEDQDTYDPVLEIISQKLKKLSGEQPNHSLSHLITAMLKRDPMLRVEEASKLLASKTADVVVENSTPIEEERKMPEIPEPKPVKLEKLNKDIRKVFEGDQPKSITQIYTYDALREMDAVVLRDDTKWVNLEVIQLTSTGIGDKIASAIGANSSWKKLWHLSLTSNNLSDIGAIALAKNTSWVYLEELILFDNKIGKEGAAALAGNMTWINLESLNLESNQLWEKGAKALAKNTSWVNLRSLNLANNLVGEEGANALASNTAWVNLETLNLENNQLKESGAEALAKNSSWVSLKSLNVSNCMLGEKGAISLGSNKSWKFLKELYLRKNQISDGGVEAISGNVTWSELEVIDLSHNLINQKGVETLGNNKLWSKLKEMFMRNNPGFNYNTRMVIPSNKLFGKNLKIDIQ